VDHSQEGNSPEDILHQRLRLPGVVEATISPNGLDHEDIVVAGADVKEEPRRDDARGVGGDRGETDAERWRTVSYFHRSGRPVAVAVLVPVAVAETGTPRWCCFPQS
jgi:hypothetical protein